MVHRVEDAPLHRLEAVAHVGQGPRIDDRDSVIQVTTLRLGAQGDCLDVLRHEAFLHHPTENYSPNCSNDGLRNPGQFRKRIYSIKICLSDTYDLSDGSVANYFVDISSLFFAASICSIAQCAAS